NGKQLRIRPVEHIGEEIEYLLTCGVEEITFADSILNVPYEHSLQIFEEIGRRKLKFRWNSYMHLQNITEEYVQLAMDAGCSSMLFSPDAYSQPALDGMQKGITTSTIDASMELFYTTPAFKELQVAYCFFLSPVGETMRGMLQSLLFFVQWKLKRRKKIGIILAWIRLEPFTRAYETACKEKSIPKDLDLLPHDTDSLAQSFYVAPAVSALDFLLLTSLRLVRKILRALKFLLKLALSKR
ncbi:MAG: hypothetical protein D3923_02430, partial [Candidatus Electrothrix sp. AR3]|nr:hypothetical protein [Candidatus Electrothrix sp. AR3]